MEIEIGKWYKRKSGQEFIKITDIICGMIISGKNTFSMIEFQVIFEELK